MSEKSPTNNLKIIVNYIMNIYIPFWFAVKLKSSIKEGARHFHKFIKLTRYLDKKYLKVIDPVISRNAYFGHPENILLSMLSDPSLDVRQEAIEKIIEARRTNDNAAVRRFHVVPLNFYEFLNHTQAVERIEKLVTETSGLVYGQKNRDGRIRINLISRNCLPEVKVLPAESLINKKNFFKNFFISHFIRYNREFFFTILLDLKV